MSQSTERMCPTCEHSDVNRDEAARITFKAVGMCAAVNAEKNRCPCRCVPPEIKHSPNCPNNKIYGHSDLPCSAECQFSHRCTFPEPERHEFIQGPLRGMCGYADGDGLYCGQPRDSAAHTKSHELTCIICHRLVDYCICDGPATVRQPESVHAAEPQEVALPDDYCAKIGDCRFCSNPNGNCTCTHHAVGDSPSAPELIRVKLLPVKVTWSCPSCRNQNPVMAHRLAEHVPVEDICQVCKTRVILGEIRPSPGTISGRL